MISGVLPIRNNRWLNIRPMKDEVQRVLDVNSVVNTVNWRLLEVSTTTKMFHFVSWPEFTEPNGHLLGRDGLHTCHEGTYIVARKFLQVIRDVREFPARNPSTPVPPPRLVSGGPIPMSSSLSVGPVSVCQQQQQKKMNPVDGASVPVPKPTPTPSSPTTSSVLGGPVSGASCPVPTPSPLPGGPVSGCKKKKKKQQKKKKNPVDVVSVPVPTPRPSSPTTSSVLGGPVSGAICPVPTPSPIPGGPVSGCKKKKKQQKKKKKNPVDGASVPVSKPTPTPSSPTTSSVLGGPVLGSSCPVPTPSPLPGGPVSGCKKKKKQQKKQQKKKKNPVDGASVPVSKPTPTPSSPTTSSVLGGPVLGSSCPVPTPSPLPGGPVSGCKKKKKQQKKKNSVDGASVPVSKPTPTPSSPTTSSVLYGSVSGCKKKQKKKSTTKKRQTSSRLQKYILQCVFKAGCRRKPFLNVKFFRKVSGATKPKMLDSLSVEDSTIVPDVCHVVPDCVNRTMNKMLDSLSVEDSTIVPDVCHVVPDCVNLTMNKMLDSLSVEDSTIVPDACHIVPDCVNLTMNKMLDSLSVEDSTIVPGACHIVPDCVNLTMNKMLDSLSVEDSTIVPDVCHVVPDCVNRTMNKMLDSLSVEDSTIVPGACHIVPDCVNRIMNKMLDSLSVEDSTIVPDACHIVPDCVNRTMNKMLDSFTADEYSVVSDCSDITQVSFSVPRLVGGGPENLVNMFSENNLTPKMARSILENPDESKVMSTPPLNPKGGEVFVFDNGGDSDKTEDWRADKYIWVNRGGFGIPRKSTSFWKITYNISRHSGDTKGDSNFKKYVYIFKDKPDWPYVLIHYHGDETSFIPRPHGNSVTNTRPHERTAGSVVSKLKSKVMQNPAGKVYAENINNGDVASVHQGILNARDKRQIKNLATIQRKKFRVSHDELYGSLQLAYHINDFVKLMSVFPDIRIILGSKDILSELNTLLTVKSDEPVLLSYDTTFNVGDYFVSVLVFRHVLFKNGVTIPAAFLIHDRKNQRTHDDFFRILSDEVPNLKKGQHVIVTDRERVFTNAINKYLPNLKQVFCWNHLRRDLRYWLRSTRSKSRNVDDVGTCSKQLFELMQCESLVAFEELEGEFKADWSPELVEYFDTKLRSDILGHSCRWLLEEFNVYDPYSGVTNNMSEGTNNVIEGLQNWHGAPLDAIVLSMHYLQKFKYNEIIRGRLNKGNFRLKSMHQNASLSPEDVDMPNDASMRPKK